MGGWAYCKKHQRRGHVSTSPKFAVAAKSNELISREDIRYIQFNSPRGVYQCAVDLVFFQKFEFPADCSVAVLNDRDKSAKQLNDRVLIVKIRKEMRGVCPDCLDEVLAPPGPIE